MMLTLKRFFLVVLGVSAFGLTGGELFPEGVFAQYAPGKLEGNWRKSRNSPDDPQAKFSRIQRLADGKNILSITQRTPERERLWQHDVSLEAKTGSGSARYAELTFSVRARVSGLKRGAQNWQSARFMLDFFDAGGQRIPEYHALAFQADSDWTTLSREVKVPPQAVRMQANCGFFYGASGTLDIEMISVAGGKVMPDYAKIAAIPPQQTVLTPTRRELVLNGYWKFSPVAADGKLLRAGYLRVPGAWTRTHDYMRPNLDGPVAIPPDAGWDSRSLRNLYDGCYEKSVRIPDDWTEGEIGLELDRVCSSAEVFVNGARAGVIYWPHGKLDMSPYLKPGMNADFRILVRARSRMQMVEDFSYYTPSRKKGEIYTRGLCGDAVLTLSPRTVRVESLFIKPSVRHKNLTVDVECTLPEKTEMLNVRLSVRDSDGRVACGKSFQRQVDKGGNALISCVMAWENPKLWDLRQPNLYHLTVELESGGRRDVVTERFGFREFRVDGRGFLLNEKPFRIRPIDPSSRNIGGMPEAVVPVMKDYLGAGFNCLELFPDNYFQSGIIGFRKEWAGCADEVGLPLIMPMMDFSAQIPWGHTGTMEKINAWEKEFIADWKQLRNHPSILILEAGFNRFGSNVSSSPTRIGNGPLLSASPDQYYRKLTASGNEIMARMRKLDPTRPAMTHAGGPVGDVHSMNLYLNFIPLREREKYLSDWCRKGDRPIMIVEFGCPLSMSMMRGRECGPGKVLMTEPMLTEVASIYLGADAFRNEWEPYRKDVRDTWLRFRSYRTWHSRSSMDFNPVFQDLLSLFIRRTFRAWRTWGISGGMVPWSKGNGWMPPFSGNSPVATARTGGRGPIVESVPTRLLKGFAPEYLTAAGRELVAANSDTLVYIAGSGADFTDQSHHYFGGESVRKQLAVVSDLRDVAHYALEWQARRADGEVIAGGRLSGMVAPGESLLREFEFVAPDCPARTMGEITVTGTIGGQLQRPDRFAFCVYPRKGVPPPPVRLYDTNGETAAFMRNAGFPFQTVARIPAEPDGTLLVVGEKNLHVAGFPFAELEAWVKKGGKLLLMNDDPDFLRQRFGFRIGRHLSRQVFRVDSAVAGTAFADVANDEMRDWRGASDFVPATGGVALNDESLWKKRARYGYHWGNDGSVSSAPVEKPHASGWTPFFENEYALSYSPLMRLRFGEGAVWLCTFDFASRDRRDPAAEALFARIIVEGSKAQTGKSGPVFLLGATPEERGLLDKMQLIYQPATALPPPGALAVIGADWAVDRTALTAFLENGGRALFLPRRAGAQLPGFRIADGSVAKITGVPGWEAARGLSLSDLHLKCDLIRTPLLQAADGEAQTAANGLLGRYRVGRGELIALQLLPGHLQAEKWDYYKFSAWRWTRVLAQLLANSGAVFGSDLKFFQAGTGQVERLSLTLPSVWRAHFERKVTKLPEGDGRLKDEGNAGEKLNFHRADFDDGSWRRLAAGCNFQTQGGEFDNANGVLWYRVKFHVPETWRGKKAVLHLGQVDDMDTTYFNGRKIGRTGLETPNFYAVRREYPVPPECIRYGQENTVAIRVFDHFGYGGLLDIPVLKEARDKAGAGWVLYSDDFNDGDDGDDVYRYMNW